jgi:Flp pilus assembly protein TadG
MSGSPADPRLTADSSRRATTPRPRLGKDREVTSHTSATVTRRPDHHSGPDRADGPLWSLQRWARDDRGSATAFGLFLIVVVLVLAGAMLEGGNAMSGRGHATDIAQQAARAGADKLDLAALREDGLVRVDPAAAEAAAAAFLAQVGETGTVTATPAQVSVTVTVTRPGILVPILGIKTLTVRATATAAPIVG